MALIDGSRIAAEIEAEQQAAVAALVRDRGTRSGRARLCGDIDFESVREVAGLITPVPGGVGPMTVTMLIANTLRSAELRLGG